MKYLPKTWQIKKLAEVISSENGCWGPENVEKGAPILRSTNFNNDGSISFESIARRYIKNEDLKEKYLKEGDILLERSGGGPQQPVGRVVYFPQIKERFYFGNFITRLRTKDVIFPKFLFYILHFYHQQGITDKLQNQTTGIRNLRFKEYLELQIPLPPLPVQYRIVRKIEDLFEKVDKAKNLREEAVKDTGNIIPSALNEVFSRTKKEEWKRNRIVDLIEDIKTGTTPPSGEEKYFNGEIHWFTPEDLGVNKYLFQSNRKITHLAIKEKKAKIFRKNTILFVGIGATLGKVGIAGDDVSANQQITGLYFKNFITPDYVYYWFRYNYDYIRSLSAKVTLPIINQKGLCSLTMEYPDIEKQRHIVKYLDSLQSQVERLK